MRKEHTPVKNSFDKIYNALHSWGNNSPPDKSEILIALKANCKIHESHAELLEALTLAEQALTGHINTLETELGVTLDKSAIEKAREAIAKARGKDV